VNAVHGVRAFPSVDACQESKESDCCCAIIMAHSTLHYQQGTGCSQIFRNSNLTGSFPTPTSVKDGVAPHLAHIVCSALLYFQIKSAPGTF
jgi:hypothetical protein